MNIDCMAVVLAAGEGKRMKSKTPKALHKVAGKALTGWVADAAREATGAGPVLVVGSGADAVREYFGDTVRYAVQEQQLGSGHAVMSAREHLKGDGYVLVVAGDMPMIKAQTLRRIAQQAQEKALGVCLLTAVIEDPAGYGRVLREGTGVRIVEHRDATEAERAVQEVNLSVYCFHIPALLKALDGLKADNNQGEYYITDCVHDIVRQGYAAVAVVCDDPDEYIGVNDRVQLAEAARLMRRRINNKLMMDGVTILDPDSTYIEAGCGHPPRCYFRGKHGDRRGCGTVPRQPHFEQHHRQRHKGAKLGAAGRGGGR